MELIGYVIVHLTVVLPANNDRKWRIVAGIRIGGKECIGKEISFYDRQYD